MDTSPWPQEIVVKPMDEIVVTNTTTNQKPPPSSTSSILEGKERSQNDHHHHNLHHQQVALKCPRCNSSNTKFCYYNNYSLSQPRYFCKTCKRYWTEGGSLRNIPAGGGSRKNKRPQNSSSSPYSSTSGTNISTSSKKLPGNNLPQQPPLPSLIAQQNPNSKIHENTPQDLSLGFMESNPAGGDDRGFKSLSEMIRGPSSFGNNKDDVVLQINSSSADSLSNISAMELLNGFTGSSRGLDTDHHRHHPNTVYSIGFPFSSDQFMMKPSLSFSPDGLGNNYGSFEENKGKLLFPLEDLKHHASDDADHKGDNADSSAGFWNGVIGGGSCN